jgi:hypothetical protein
MIHFWKDLRQATIHRLDKYIRVHISAVPRNHVDFDLACYEYNRLKYRIRAAGLRRYSWKSIRKNRKFFIALHHKSRPSCLQDCSTLPHAVKTLIIHKFNCFLSRSLMFRLRIRRPASSSNVTTDCFRKLL